VIKEVYGGKPCLAHQEAMLRSTAFMRAAWGGLGSGKTTSGALACLQLCAENPWRPEYGRSRPTFLIAGVTRSTIRDSSYKALMEILPSEAIAKERKADGEIYLRNGAKILMRSVRGTFTGITAFGAWLDEAHLMPSSEKWPDLQMRVRDTRARTLGVIVTGVPVEIAWLRTTFGMPEHATDRERFTVHCSTYDNHYLEPMVLEQLKSSVGAADVDTYLKGQWHKPEGAVFPEFEAPRHVVPMSGDKQRPVHLSIDVGSQSAVVVAQDTATVLDAAGRRVPGQGLHVVDEEITDAIETGPTIARVLARGWKLTAGESVVCVDPRSHRDVVSAVRAAVPAGVRVVIRKQGEPEYDVDYGVRAMRAALRDATGKTRLTFSASLPTTRRSLLTAMPSTRYKPGSRIVHKDNARDHQVDALRYIVCARLPLVMPGKITVTDKR
jgi:hypothetical protein